MPPDGPGRNSGGQAAPPMVPCCRRRGSGRDPGRPTNAAAAPITSAAPVTSAAAPDHLGSADPAIVRAHQHAAGAALGRETATASGRTRTGA